MGNVQGAVVRPGIGRLSTWLSTCHAHLLWTQSVSGLMGCSRAAFPTAGLHVAEAEIFLWERRFSVGTYLPAVEYVDECSCH
jgi:hypothetical protein